jgi:Mor family transcriptional regulator
MGFERMAERNRQMLCGFEAGMSVEDLVQKYGLAKSTVSAIITTERHRRAVSPNPVYKALRLGPASNQIFR